MRSKFSKCRISKLVEAAICVEECPAKVAQALSMTAKSIGPSSYWTRGMKKVGMPGFRNVLASRNFLGAQGHRQSVSVLVGSEGTAAK